MTTFRRLLDEFENAAKTRVAKGRRFEEFCRGFFKTDPYERFQRRCNQAHRLAAVPCPCEGYDYLCRYAGGGGGY